MNELWAAEKADYDTTHTALLEALKASDNQAALGQTRLTPNPASVFGEYCASALRQHIAILGEPVDADGSVSLVVMLRYNYGFSLPASLTVATANNLLEKLAEMKASQGLGLIDPLDFDTLLTAQNLVDIQHAASQYREAEGGTLLGRLGSEVIPTLELALAQTAPIATMTRIIRGESAQGLALQLIAALGWVIDELPPTLIDRLLWKAISVDLEGLATQQQGCMGGYEFAQADNWGRSCDAILADMHNHLLAVGKAASMGEAILATCVLALNNHPEWLLGNIADELPYATSCAWVNFQHGVTLAEAIEFGSSRWMSFEDLNALPAFFSRDMNTVEQRVAYSASRLAPLLLWAQANSHLRPQTDTAYSQLEIEQAISAFERYEDEALQAANALDQPPPDRRRMALAAFANARRTPQIAHELEQQGYTQPPWLLDASITRLVPKHYSNVYYDASRHLKFAQEAVYQVTPRSATLLELYMAGENIDDWRLPGNYRGEDLRVVNTELRLLYNALPAMAEVFEHRFQAYLEDARMAYATVIRLLIISLPVRHRLAIENGALTLYSLRLPVVDVMAATENETHREPLRGRYGFIIRADYHGQTLYYEVFPRQMLVRHRDDLSSLATGGTLTTEFWQTSSVIPYPASVYAGTTLPFDQAAYLNGSKPKKAATATLIADVITPTTVMAATAPGQHAPLTQRSNRCMAIARTITAQLFYVNTDRLHAQCKAITATELHNNQPGTLEALGETLKSVLLWNSLQDIASGERKRISAGSLTVSLYLLPYGKPAGKLLAGSAHVVFRAGSALLVRNGGARVSSLKSLLFAVLKGASATRLNRAMLEKMATGVGQFAQNHITWRFVAIRAGIGISRRVAAQARRLDDREAE